MPDHDIDSADCWCRPEFFKACDECSKGCWKCDRGMIWITREEVDDPDLTCVIIHVYEGDVRESDAWLEQRR